MRDMTEANLTDAVLAKLAGATNPRFQQVMSSLLRHLHAFVREVELTEAEWFALLDEVERQAQEQHNDRMTGRMAEH